MFDALAQGVIGPCLFGKHPCWADHMEDLNLDHPALAFFKQKFYVEMISHGLGRGFWKQAEMDGALPWNHALHALIGDAWLSARASRSQDAKGRSQYPLMAAKAGRGSESAHEWLRSEASLKTLLAQAHECDSQDELRKGSFLRADEMISKSPVLSPQEILQGIYQALNVSITIEEWLARVVRALNGIEDGQVWVRVPAHPSFPGVSAAAWLTFWEKMIPSQSQAHWAIHRDDVDYIDLISGLYVDGAWRGIFSKREDQAMAVDIPYRMESEETERIAKWWEEWKEAPNWLEKPAVSKSTSFWSRIFGT